MKRKVLISLFFCCLFLEGYGQNLAGYLGRQITVYGNFKSFLRINQAAKESKIPFNTKLGAGVDFVVAKRVSLGLEFETFKTGFSTDLPYLEESYSSYYSSYSDNPFDVRYTSVDLGAQVKTYGAYINLFSGQKGHLAPYGKYQIMGAKLMSVTEKDFRNSLKVYNAERGMHLIDPEYSTYGYGLTYGVGKKWIYFDRLIVDVRVQSCMVLDKDFLPVILNSKNDTYDNYSNNIDFELTMEEDMLKRVSLHSLLDFSFSMGWLLF